MEVLVTGEPTAHTTHAGGHGVRGRTSADVAAATAVGDVGLRIDAGVTAADHAGRAGADASAAAAERPGLHAPACAGTAVGGIRLRVDFAAVVGVAVAVAEAHVAACHGATARDTGCTRMRGSARGEAGATVGHVRLDVDAARPAGRGAIRRTRRAVVACVRDIARHVRRTAIDTVGDDIHAIRDVDVGHHVHGRRDDIDDHIACVDKRGILDGAVGLGDVAVAGVVDRAAVGTVGEGRAVARHDLELVGAPRREGRDQHGRDDHEPPCVSKERHGALLSSPEYATPAYTRRAKLTG